MPRYVPFDYAPSVADSTATFETASVVLSQNFRSRRNANIKPAGTLGLPHEIECSICHTPKNHRAFSQRQKDTYARYREDITCLDCSGVQKTELRCMTCEKTFPLSHFAKSQRTKREEAECNACVRERCNPVEKPKVAEDEAAVGGGAKGEEELAEKMQGLGWERKTPTEGAKTTWGGSQAGRSTWETPKSVKSNGWGAPTGKTPARGTTGGRAGGWGPPAGKSTGWELPNRQTNTRNTSASQKSAWGGSTTGSTGGWNTPASKRNGHSPAKAATPYSPPVNDGKWAKPAKSGGWVAEREGEDEFSDNESVVSIESSGSEASDVSL